LQTSRVFTFSFITLVSTVADVLFAAVFLFALLP
jgi:hypothetical protein